MSAQLNLTGDPMITSCPVCRSPVLSRTWIPGVTAFIEVYTCGSVTRWGEGARALDGCGGAIARRLEPPLTPPGEGSSVIRDHVLAQPHLAHVRLGTDLEMLRTLVESIGRSDKPRGCSLWSHVGARLGHGSGVSWAICKALGLDPEKDGLKRRRLMAKAPA